MKYSPLTILLAIGLACFSYLSVLAQAEEELPKVDAPSVLIDGLIKFDNIQFDMHRIDLWSEINNLSPKKDLYLVILGEIASTDMKRACLKKGDFQLEIGTRKYSAATVANSTAKKVYGIDYPKTLIGHCVKNNDIEKTFLLFDISDQNGRARITFDKTKTMTIATSVKALINEAGFNDPTPTPTSTRRPTRTPRPTKTSRPTQTPTVVTTEIPTPANSTTVAANSPEVSETIQKSYPTSGVAIQNGNLLGGPGDDYTPIAGIFSGTEVVIVGASSDGLWYELEGNYWVDANFIQLETGSQDRSVLVQSPTQADDQTAVVATSTPTNLPAPTSTPALPQPTITPYPTLSYTATPYPTSTPQVTDEELIYLYNTADAIDVLEGGADAISALLGLLEQDSLLFLSEEWQAAMDDAVALIVGSDSYIRSLTPSDRLASHHYLTIAATTQFRDGALLLLEALDELDRDKLERSAEMFTEGRRLKDLILDDLNSVFRQ